MRRPSFPAEPSTSTPIDLSFKLHLRSSQPSTRDGVTNKPMGVNEGCYVFGSVPDLYTFFDSMATHRRLGIHPHSCSFDGALITLRIPSCLLRTRRSGILCPPIMDLVLVIPDLKAMAICEWLD